MSNQSLEFTLLNNHLKSDGRYMAKIVNQKTVGFEALLKEMENNTALRKEDIRLAISHFMNAVKGNLIRGMKVETPLGVFRTSIRGSFSSLTEDFRPFADANNHEIRVSFNPNRSLEEEVISGIVTEKVLENKVKYPKVASISNLNSPGDGSFKPFHVLSAVGVNLKIDAAAEDEGVFWTNPQGAITKTPVVSFSTNTRLQFQIPQLEPGTYSLSIATRLGNHALRTTTLDEPIVIS